MTDTDLRLEHNAEMHVQIGLLRPGGSKIWTLGF
jgi:hypothetical protein